MSVVLELDMSISCNSTSTISTLTLQLSPHSWKTYNFTIVLLLDPVSHYFPLPMLKKCKYETGLKHVWSEKRSMHVCICMFFYAAFIGKLENAVSLIMKSALTMSSFSFSNGKICKLRDSYGCTEDVPHESTTAQQQDMSTRHKGIPPVKNC